MNRCISNTSKYTALILLFSLCVLAQPQTVSANQALEWVEEAHQKVEGIFEGCITERLREIFQEVK